MRINYKQKLVIMASAFIIGFMCIFPPWNFVFASRPEVMSSQKAGYGFILTPPKPVKYVPIKPPKTGSIFEGIENELARKEGRVRIIGGREYIIEEDTSFIARIDFERLLVQCFVGFFLGFGVGVFLNLEKGNITKF